MMTLAIIVGSDDARARPASGCGPKRGMRSRPCGRLVIPLFTFLLQCFTSMKIMFQVQAGNMERSLSISTSAIYLTLESLFTRADIVQSSHQRKSQKATVV